MAVKTTAGWRRRYPELGLLGVVVSVIALRALPDNTFLDAFSLILAAGLIVLVPGAAFLRAIGWPDTPSGLVALSFVWSVPFIALSLLVAFALETSLVGGLAALALTTSICLFLGRDRPLPRYAAEDWRTLGLVFGFSLICAFAVFWAPVGEGNARGDWVEHLGRVRKLTDFSSLFSLDAIQIVGPDTGLHPMYAFPAWHAALGYIATIADVDPTFAVVNISPIIVPIAVITAYYVGLVVFRSKVLGLGVVVLQFLWAGLPWSLGGFFRFAYPGFVCTVILFPVAIALVFEYLRNRDWRILAGLGATSVGLTLLHASYIPLALIPIGGFLLLHVVLERTKEVVRAAGMALAALVVPFLAYVPWIYPVASAEGTSLSPREQRRFSIRNFETLLDVGADGETIRISGDAFVRSGAVLILAVILAPLCFLGIRRRWGAFVVASFLSISVTLMTYVGFGLFAEVMNVSQTRRLIYFLPVPFAIVGGSLILARHKLVLPAAAAAGVLLWLTYPGDHGYQMQDPGPGWLAWGSMIALAIGVLSAFVFRDLKIGSRARFAGAAVFAFCIPIMVGQIIEAPSRAKNRPLMPPAFIQGFEQRVDTGDVVFGSPPLMYRLTAAAPVYANSVTRGHGGDTQIAELDLRYEDSLAFFDQEATDEEAAALLEKYDSEWLVTEPEDKTPSVVKELPLVFEAEGHKLYRVPDDLSSISSS